MDQHERHFYIAGLIGKFLRSELSSEEEAQLREWINESDKHKALWEHMTDPQYVQGNMQYWEGHEDKKAYWERLSSEIAEKRPTARIIARKVLRYAAVLLPLIIVCGVGYYFFSRPNQRNDQTGQLAATRILPQGKVAQLILANGETVDLNDSLEEAIVEKDGTKMHNRSSALSYVSGSGVRSADILFNTLVTPRGGEYRIDLADGTKVWLNAASSLRYPTQFNGKERKVYLSGEAYFEVTKDSAHPFIVNADRMDIRVLGTKFNVSAYPDDPSRKTTLAEGMVRIRNIDLSPGNSEGVILEPGYEAVMTKNGDSIKVNKANVEAALAWKNGMFAFESESLGSLMRKLSRWYNVEVRYDEGVDTMFHFTGRMRRYDDLAGALRWIGLTRKVSFALEGGELHVKKN